MSNPTMPANMREVSKQEFWNTVMKTSLNVHPRNERLYTEWYNLSTNGLWGWTSKGYASPHEPEGKSTETYALVTSQRVAVQA